MVAQETYALMQARKWTLLVSIKAPVLIIAGTLDPYMTMDLCREAYSTLKNKDSKLVLIEGAAHAMMMEKPYYKVFRNNVLEFLKK